MHQRGVCSRRFNAGHTDRGPGVNGPMSHEPLRLACKPMYLSFEMPEKRHGEARTEHKEHRRLRRVRVVVHQPDAAQVEVSQRARRIRSGGRWDEQEGEPASQKGRPNTSEPERPCVCGVAVQIGKQPIDDGWNAGSRLGPFAQLQHQLRRGEHVLLWRHEEEELLKHQEKHEQLQCRCCRRHLRRHLAAPEHCTTCKESRWCKTSLSVALVAVACMRVMPLVYARPRAMHSCRTVYPTL
eukprot:6186355-Pleurochrysis_carterae.AAC.3